MAEWETPSSAALLRIHLLGAFRVAIGERVLDENGWGLAKAAGLVKLLALAPRHRMLRERALDQLWPEAALANAANSLHRTLHVARRVLEPDHTGRASWSFLHLRGDVLVLSPSTPVWVDVDAFEQAAALARHSGSLADYARALDLYTGDLLPHDLYEDWTPTRREELHEVHVALLAEAARLHVAKGSRREAMAMLRKLVRAEPVRENAHVALMCLYALSGERYEALRQFQRLRTVLRDELDTAPGPAARRLYAAIQAGQFPPRGEAALGRSQPVVSAPRASTPPSSPRHDQSTAHGTPRPSHPSALAAPPALTNGLGPQTTSFIGRAHELAELRRLLAENRLVTLTGPGGCGKTRLAARAAECIMEDGEAAHIDELASLADPALVVQAVAAAARAREEPDRPLAETLAETLRSRRVLLVLDNCEHVLDACTALGRWLLAECPRLRMLATSRQPLGIVDEAVWSVPSLALPDPERLPPLARLMEYDGVRLFSA